MADAVNEYSDLPEPVRMVREAVSDFDRWSDNPFAQMERAYDFEAGRQWEDSDIKVLNEQKRPPIVFNRILKFVDSVVGAELANAVGVRYKPVGTEDTGPTDLISQVIQQMTAFDAPDEHGEAKRDALVCGMGWTDMRMSFDDSIEGRFQETRIDPLSMGWDFRAKKRNLADARWLFHRCRYRMEEIEERWPEKAGEITSSDVETHSRAIRHDPPYSPSEDRDRPESDALYDSKSRYEVVHFQRWDIERRVIAFDQATGRQADFSPVEWATLASRLADVGMPLPPHAVKPRKIFRQAYVCGSVLLEESEVAGFTYFPITGKRDRNKGYWYGLVRVVEDPQMWANKFLSNVMHIMSSAGKGPMVEKSAVPLHDQRRFEEDFSRPDKIKWVEDGAISRGAIKEMEPPPLPGGLSDLMQFAVTSIADTLGINLEFLGMTSRTQSGVVERSRRQAGLAVLGDFFKAFRLHAKAVGEMRLKLALQFVSDQTFVRIGGQEAMRHLPAIRSAGFQAFDVVVDEVPSSPNQKEEAWFIIQQMLPVLLKQGLSPDVWIALLEYSPLPAKVVEKIAAALKQPNPVAQIGQQLEMAEKKAKVGQIESATALNLAKARETGQPDFSGVAQALAQIEQTNRQATMEQADHDNEMRRITANAMVSEREHGMKLQEIAAKHAASVQQQAMKARNERRNQRAS